MEKIFNIINKFLNFIKITKYRIVLQFYYDNETIISAKYKISKKYTINTNDKD